jgi:hypothetical protein
MGLLSIRVLPTGPDKPPRILTVLFVVIGAVAITGMVRYLRAIVSEFRYDGSTLRFRTVGSRKPLALPLRDIVPFRNGKGGAALWDIGCNRGTETLVQNRFGDAATGESAFL